MLESSKRMDMRGGVARNFQVEFGGTDALADDIGLANLYVGDAHGSLHREFGMNMLQKPDLPGKRKMRNQNGGWAT